VNYILVQQVFEDFKEACNETINGTKRQQFTLKVQMNNLIELCIVSTSNQINAAE
jgi:hypothetical protein